MGVITKSIKTCPLTELVMDVNLYVKEGGKLRTLKVPAYVVKDLLRDRLSQSELNRINKLAEKTQVKGAFKPGSVVVDFSKKTAHCFNAKIGLHNLDPTWDVTVEKVTLGNY